MTTPIVPAMKPSASPEREAIASIIAEQARFADQPMTVTPFHRQIADAILAAGFRRDPGWIATIRRLREAIDKAKDFLRDVDMDAEDANHRAFIALVNAEPLPPAPEAREGTTT
jgi:hypothetical protein